MTLLNFLHMLRSKNLTCLLVDSRAILQVNGFQEGLDLQKVMIHHH